MKRLLLITGGILGLSVFSFALSSNFGVTKVGGALYKIENPNSISATDRETLKNDIMQLYGLDGSQDQYNLDMIQLIHWPGRGAYSQMCQQDLIPDFNSEFAVSQDDFIPSPQLPYLYEMNQILSKYATQQ